MRVAITTRKPEFKTSASGTLSFGHTVAGDPDVSLAGLVPSGGAVRHYQVLYRDTATFCGAATFNQTNGLMVPWAP